MTFLPDESQDEGELIRQKYARQVQTWKEGVRATFLLFAAALVMILGVCSLLFGPGFFDNYKIILALKEHGVGALATVDRIRKEDCGRGCTWDVADIHFLDTKLNIIQSGTVIVYYQKSDQDLYDYASIKRKIPVIYDPLNPDMYRENFNNKIGKMDAKARLISDLATPLAIWVAFLLALCAWSWVNYNKSPSREDLAEGTRSSRFGRPRSGAQW